MLEFIEKLMSLSYDSFVLYSLCFIGVLIIISSFIDNLFKKLFGNNIKIIKKDLELIN
jgi:hypothetical protein